MPVLATQNPTLADVAKSLDPDGKVATLVEILSETNEILDDMSWMEGNLPTGHRHVIRTGLPEPTWRELYKGVQPTKSQRAPVTDTVGMMEAYAEIDCALADLNGNTAAFRFQEDRAHIQGMSHQLAETLFYGNESVNPERFTGLAPRYSTGVVASAASADNVIHGGGSGSDNMSVWLCVWGPNSGWGIYPKGSSAGLKHTDKGQVTIEDADGNGGRMEAYRSHYRWDCGLAISDWRYFVRIANISKAALRKDAASGADLVDLMTEAMHRPPSLSAGRPVFYANRTAISYLDRQMKNAKNVNITVEQLGGKRSLMFGGIPVRRCDALLETEAVVPMS